MSDAEREPFRPTGKKHGGNPIGSNRLLHNLVTLVSHLDGCSEGVSSWLNLLFFGLKHWQIGSLHDHMRKCSSREWGCDFKTHNCKGQQLWGSATAYHSPSPPTAAVSAWSPHSFPTSPDKAQSPQSGAPGGLHQSIKIGTRSRSYLPTPL